MLNFKKGLLELTKKSLMEDLKIDSPTTIVYDTFKSFVLNDLTFHDCNVSIVVRKRLIDDEDLGETTEVEIDIDITRFIDKINQYVELGKYRKSFNQLTFIDLSKWFDEFDENNEDKELFHRLQMRTFEDK